MNNKTQQLIQDSRKVVGYTDGGYTEIKVLDAEKLIQAVIADVVKTCEDHSGWTARMIANQIKDNYGVE